MKRNSKKGMEGMISMMIGRSYYGSANFISESTSHAKNRAFYLSQQPGNLTRQYSPGV